MSETNIEKLAEVVFEQGKELQRQSLYIGFMQELVKRVCLSSGVTDEEYTEFIHNLDTEMSIKLNKKIRLEMAMNN